MSALICGITQAAIAEPRPAAPRVDGGAECKAALVAASAFARHAPSGADGSEVQASIEIGPRGQWRAEVVGPTGTRRVEDAACRVVARAAGVIAALMVREAAELRAVSGGEIPDTALPDPDANSDPGPTPDPDPETGIETDADVWRSWMAVRVGAGIGDGMGPTGDVTVAWGLPRGLSVELAARHGRAGIEGPAGLGWDRALTTGRLAACMGAKRITGCAGAEAGAMSLSGSLPEQGRLRGRGGWIAPTAAAAFSLWRQGDLSLHARAAVGYAVVKPAFLTLDDELIHSPSRLSAHMSVSVGYHLW